jgi:hypothetical protein
MKTAPVFLFVEPSLLFQAVLHKWLQNTLNPPDLLAAGNGWFDHSFFLDTIGATRTEEHIRKEKRASELLPR